MLLYLQVTGQRTRITLQQGKAVIVHWNKAPGQVCTVYFRVCPFSLPLSALPLPRPSAEHHMATSRLRTQQTPSGEWFCFCGPPKAADSPPDNKIVQGSNNFNSFHQLTAMRQTPQDTQSKSPDVWFCHGLVFFGSTGHTHTSSIHSAPPGSPNGPQPPPSHAAQASHPEKAFLARDCGSIHPAGKRSARSDAWRLDLDSSSLETRAATCQAVQIPREFTGEVIDVPLPPSEIGELSKMC